MPKDPSIGVLESKRPAERCVPRLGHHLDATRLPGAVRYVDILHRQATSSFYDHALIDAVVGVLEDRGGVARGQVETRWRELIDQYNDEIDERERFEERTREILAAFAGADLSQFSSLIREGTSMMLDGKARPGARRLEKAYSLDPKNGPLGLLLGEHFFFVGRRAPARRYLEQAVASNPSNTVAELPPRVSGTVELVRRASTRLPTVPPPPHTPAMDDRAVMYAS